MTEHPLGHEDKQYEVEPAKTAKKADGCAERVVEMVVNLDDATGELLGYVIGKMMKLGALDAWGMPIVMKKGRPAYAVSVLVGEDDREKMGEALLKETGSFGLRFKVYERMTLMRTIHRVHTSLGELPIKVGAMSEEPEKVVTAKPEYDAMVKLAEEHGLSLKRVQEIGNAAASHLVDMLNQGNGDDDGGDA
ncbi:DUF111 family protein [Planctomycetota bacterium]|nr:DUF111 family protein [Planctomycetota bacterium]